MGNLKRDSFSSYVKEGGETTSTFWKNELGNPLAMVKKPLGKVATGSVSQLVRARGLFACL
jgi:hypothetical protein